jgi:acyl-CoA thioester hydrolase
MLPNARETFSFFHTLRVRWAEVDAQGIVFNPNYLVYFDVGGTEYMRAIGYVYPTGFAEHGTDLFTVNANANYRSSAHCDDLLDLGVRVGHIGRTSVRFEFVVLRGEELIVDGSLVYACAGGTPRVAMPVPPPFIAKILEFEKTPPTRA